MKILLGWEEVNPNRRYNDGKTPLMWVPATKAESNDGGLGFGDLCGATIERMKEQGGEKTNSQAVVRTAEYQPRQAG